MDKNSSTKTNYESKRLTIPEWAVSDRPREKYLTFGSRYVSDAELIAILLRNGTPTESAVELAKRLLSKNQNSINTLAKASIDELMQVRGIGKVKAITLHAAFELGRRRRAENVEKAKQITNTQDVVELMQSKIAELPHEEFWAIYVNQSSHILKLEQLGTGGITATIVDVRLVIKAAIALNATGMFLCHNHPSGNVHPSEADIVLTKRIQKAATMFDIRVIDHLVIHKDNFYSFFAESLL